MDYQLLISDVATARRAFAAAGAPVRTERGGVLVTTLPLAAALRILKDAGVAVQRQWPPAPVAPCLDRSPRARDPQAGSGGRDTTTRSPA